MSGIHWPSFCVGAIVAVYWARVLRLVLKVRRTTGRAANILPPEPLGRALRIAWFPTVVLWVVLPFLSAARGAFSSDWPLLRRLYDQPFVAWLAVVVALIALGATLICWRRMGRSWRMGIDPQEQTRLIVTGPYAYVRHPIYALSSLLMIATVVAVPMPAMIVVAVAHLLLLQWEARREERHLVTAHGMEYQTYVRRVGRFVPRSWTPYAPQASDTSVEHHAAPKELLRR